MNLIEMSLRLPLLADLGRLQELGSNFRGEKAAGNQSQLVVILIVVAIVVLAAWGLAKFVSLRDPKRKFDSPRALFGLLCRTHGLSRAEQATLSAMARTLNLSTPCQLFLAPECFAADRWRSGAVSMDEVQQVAAKLFAE